MEDQKIGVTPRAGKPELIVIFAPNVDVHSARSEATASTSDMPSVQDILGRHSASIRLLFGPSVDRLRGQMMAMSADMESQEDELPDLSAFYRVDAPEDAPEDALERLARELCTHKHVKAAYVKPGAAPAIFARPTGTISAAAPSVTPNFQSRQVYLDPAPNGIDVQYAQWMVGGQGEGIRICSVEWGWLFTHEDLTESQGGVVSGLSPWPDDHGTATIGIVGGDKNAYGIMGVVPKALSVASSLSSQSVSEGIKNAADRMNPGDVMYMSIHRWGPNSNGSGQFGYIAVEWWPDDWAAIKYATSKGIIVVEAAGNGSQNLDDPIYDTARSSYGFPADFPNPFNTSNPSSGAVIVGAGAPPPGTHGHDWWGPDRSRLWYSNYGSRLDVQGQGYDVTTTGYGDLQGGDRAELYYTDTFSGTSSATPIVAGALAAVQGVLKDFGRKPVKGAKCRYLLRTTGSPQQDGDQGPARGQRIGNRPNLRELIPAAIRMTEGTSRGAKL